MNQNSKFKIQNCITNPSGAVMLTVVVIIIIIGLTGVAIYSLTSTSTFTQLISQNTSKAYYLAESGFRVVASEYNNASDPKNDALENLHGTTLTLPDNSGAFDVRLYPYWFYVDSAYTANDGSITLKFPGGTPLQDPYDATSTRISLPNSGYLKLQGKTQLATFALSPTPASPGDGISFTYTISPVFPYDILTDEEIFLAFFDSNTVSQNITQGGDLDLPGSNAIAQILPARNGSFRVYNENNDIMDYTYLEKVPAVVDPGNPPTTITLSGVDHQDPNDESVFPFSIDGNSEIYFGRNLAVFTTATSGAGTTASTKTIGEYTDVGLDGGFSTGKDTISFEDDIADFIPTMNDSTPGDTSDDPIVIDTVQKTVQLGRGLADRFGSVWYKGDSDIANCIEGNCFLGRGIRAYLEFEFDDTDSSADSTDHGDGFSFALISSATYTDGDTGEGGEYLGYAGAGSGIGLTGNGLQPPKMAVEIDTFPNSGSGDVCGNNSRRDDGNANHTAVVYWGEEVLGSFNARSTSNFLADGGGYLRIGAATPINGDPEDWSSAQGTISFWFKRDTIRYAPDNTSGDRMWGQHANMEMRFDNTGNDLALDWGTDTALSISNHPFTIEGKWYFIAITWDEVAHTLRMYHGDETTAPAIIAETPSDPIDPLYWNALVSATGITKNLFMNSSGGNGNQNYIVDGKGADLRYYDVARTAIQIQNDYNTRLNGNETNLQAYFPLQADLLDAGPNNISVTDIGSTAWSEDDVTPYFDCGTAAAAYDDNRHGAGTVPLPQNSLNTSAIDGLDGYHQVTKVPLDPNWLEDGLAHQLRFELVRPLALAEDGKIDTVYDYQIKVWIDCDGCSAGEDAQFQEVRSTFTALAPQIELTVQNGSSLELEQAIHDNLKRILFGFTQGTSGATQNITLRNFELYFLRRYPVSDLATW
jgi:type II secretory pathway pseudopilin PulG